MIKQDEGFVLSIHEYRESDGFVYFLSKEHGLLKMILPGYYKNKSKQLALGLEFSKVVYLSKYQIGRLNRITGGNSLETYQDQRNFSWLLNMALASELVIKFYQNNIHKEVYQLFERILITHRQEEDILKLLVLIFESQGIQPYVNACIVCGSSKINRLSFSQGGFLCQKHSSSKDDPNVLLCIYRLFNHEDLTKVPDNVLENTLKKLLQLLSYHSDAKINAAILRFHV